MISYILDTPYTGAIVQLYAATAEEIVEKNIR